MTTLANSLKGILESARAIPGQLGLRPHRVYLVVRTSDGAEVGDGTTVETTVEILNSAQPPRTRWLNEEALAIGGYDRATVRIGPITPDHSAGGMSVTQLRPAPGAGVNGTVNLRITGPMHPNGALYRVEKFEGHSALHYYIVAQRVA